MRVTLWAGPYDGKEVEIPEGGNTHLEPVRIGSARERNASDGLPWRFPRGEGLNVANLGGFWGSARFDPPPFLERGVPDGGGNTHPKTLEN